MTYPDPRRSHQQPASQWTYDPASRAATPPPAPPRRGSRRLATAAAVLVAVLVVAAVAASVSRGSSTNAAPRPATATTAGAAAPGPAAAAPAPAAPSGPARTVSDGTYEVGVDIVAGRWKTPGPDGSTSRTSCYWERSKDDSGNFAAVLANDNIGGPGTVTVRNGEFLKLSGPCTWTAAA